MAIVAKPLLTADLIVRRAAFGFHCSQMSVINHNDDLAVDCTILNKTCLNKIIHSQLRACNLTPIILDMEISPSVYK